MSCTLLTRLATGKHTKSFVDTPYLWGPPYTEPSLRPSAVPESTDTVLETGREDYAVARR